LNSKSNISERTSKRGGISLVYDASFEVFAAVKTEFIVFWVTELDTILSEDRAVVNPEDGGSQVLRKFCILPGVTTQKNTT
jgi:hypothetical protein